MKRTFLLLATLLVCSIARGQGGNIPNTIIAVYPGAPTGSCGNTMVAVRTDTGAFYDCLTGAWNAVAGGGGGTVTNVSGTAPITVTNPTTTPVVACATCTTAAAALTSNNLIIGSGGQAEAALGSLGSATTVLHGGAGAPTFGAVALATDVSGQLPIGAVGSAGLSGTAPISIAATGVTSCATCTTSAAALTNNSVVLGGGGQAEKTATFLTTDGVQALTVGVAAGGNGTLALSGNTSGTVTFTAPAVAGTRANPIATSNTLAGPDGNATNPTYGFANNTGVGMFQAGGIVDVTANTTVILGPNNNNSGDQWNADSAAFFPNLDNSVSFGKSGQRATNLFAVTVTPNTYSTATNCSSSASPAVCAAAAAGSVVIAAAASTVTVNTSAVTANSQIFLLADDTLGTKLGVTCNSTGATLVGGLAVTARTAGTSFQITSGATPAVNPLCISYFIIN